ncbi:MAG: beta-lactamase family protein [Nitrospiraceae bacterium]|nr:beta-lactamase family protein [Nitrospiraceae bacterium]
MRKVPNIDETLRQAVDAGDIPGVVALAATGKEVIYEGAFGKRDISKDAGMTPDTVFWIASMTKAVTSTAAMQLVERGELQLDEPIARILPDLPSQVLEGFDENGAPKLRPAKRPITLRHLLTHTAGFCYSIWNADMGRYMAHADIPSITTCQNKALTTPLISDPGERWEYGINIDFVGKAVEVVSGKRLDAYLRDHIFMPLGMTDTGFKLTDDQRHRLAAMHSRSADGSLEPIPFEIPQDPEFHMGGGGLYGTGPDYIAFLRMLLNGGALNGHRILKPETVELMAQSHIGELEVGPMKTAIPGSSNDVELYPWMVKRWGLGFLITTDRTEEGRSPGSLAWAGLGNTYFWLDRTRDVCGVILTQILPFADAKVLGLFNQFERGVYQSLDQTKDAA